MTDLPVWLDDWEHECCGEDRRTGQAVQLSLAFSRTGSVEPATGPGQITVHDDGTVTITGTAGATTGFDGPFGPGTLIQSGRVQFAIHGDAPAARVRCTGNLYETRHGAPAGTTTGQIVGIRFRPAICQKSADGLGSVVIGHEPGTELRATGDWRKHVSEEDPAPGRSSSPSGSATDPASASRPGRAFR